MTNDERTKKIRLLAYMIICDRAPWERDEGDYEMTVDMLENDPLEVVQYLVERFIED